MARRIDFEERELVLRYGGLSAALVVAREVRIPYAQIVSVEVGVERIPGTLAWRIGGNAGPVADWRTGRFRIDGRWEFWDVSDRERTVALGLDGHRFARVVLTVDDPEGIAERLRGRLPG